MNEVEKLIAIYQQVEDAGLMVTAGKKSAAELMVSHDVIPVVRCKDCKYRRNEIECPMCFEAKIEWDDDGYTEVDWITHDRTQDDGFCHRGERKDNG